MRFVLSLLLLALAPTAPSAAEPPPVEQFAQLPFMEAPSLSPDGKYLAARLAAGGKQMFGLFSLFDANAKPVIMELGEMQLNSWEWVNNDWLVLGVGAATKVEGYDVYLSRVVSVDRTGKTVKQLAWKDAGLNAGDVLWVARDGKPEILLALQTSIYINYPGFYPKVIRVDVATGRWKEQDKPQEGVMAWYADANGVVRMGVGRADGGRKSRLLYRERDNQLFRTIDRADSRKDESLLRPSLFLAEPGKAVAISDQDGFDALYELDLATLTLGKRIYGEPGYDIDGVIPTNSGDGYMGIAVTTQRPGVRWIDAGQASIQAEIDKAVGPGRMARILSYNRDGSAMIVKVGGPDQPGSYYYYAPATGTMHLIGWVSESFKNASLSPVRTVRYKARDGLEIEAVLTLPKDRPAKALPLIVLPHGGPFARDEEGWDWWVQFLASRGYAVIQPNYRGSTGYGTAFMDKGDGQWGLAMQDDLNDAMSYLAAQGIADPKRACMVGASYGGYAAMRAAQRDGALYRCAISFAGVSDLGAMLSYDRRFLYGARYADKLRESAPDLKSVSPINHANSFSAPILIVHGKKDLTVPVGQSREMVEKLRAAAKPVEYIEQPLGDHHFSRQADRLEFLKASEAFLRKYNPAD